MRQTAWSETVDELRQDEWHLMQAIQQTLGEAAPHLHVTVYWLTQGYTDRALGVAMEVPYYTARSYVVNARGCAGVFSRAELLAKVVNYLVHQCVELEGIQASILEGVAVDGL